MHSPVQLLLADGQVKECGKCSGSLISHVNVDRDPVARRLIIIVRLGPTTSQLLTERKRTNENKKMRNDSRNVKCQTLLAHFPIQSTIEFKRIVIQKFKETKHINFSSFCFSFQGVKTNRVITQKISRPDSKPFVCRNLSHSKETNHQYIFF